TRSILVDDPSILEGALRDVEEARGALDTVYTPSLIEKLMARAGPLIARTMSYLKRLRLFSLPPEEDFALREGFYITLIAPEAMEALASPDVEDLVKRFIRSAEHGAKEGEELLLEVRDWRRLAPIIEGSSFTLGFPVSRIIKKKGKGRKSRVEILRPAEELRKLLMTSLSISHVKREDRMFVRVKFDPADRVGVKPLRTYLLNRGEYDLEVGLLQGGVKL
ncbi:MAG: hypothetical protein DRJ67_10775, partial [Thermoprotei archaeon]